MSYLGQYIRGQIDSINASQSDLKIGMMARIAYRSKEGNLSNSLFLILNPDWEGKIHVLDLDKIPEQRLYELLFYSLHKVPWKEDFKGRQITILPFIQPPKTLYESVLKTRVTPFYKECYKTLFVRREGFAGVLQTNIIEYRWNTMKFPKRILINDQTKKK